MKSCPAVVVRLDRRLTTATVCRGCLRHLSCEQDDPRSELRGGASPESVHPARGHVLIGKKKEICFLRVAGEMRFDVVGWHTDCTL